MARFELNLYSMLLLAIVKLKSHEQVFHVKSMELFLNVQCIWVKSWVLKFEEYQMYTLLAIFWTWIVIETNQAECDTKINVRKLNTTGLWSEILIVKHFRKFAEWIVCTVKDGSMNRKSFWMTKYSLSIPRPQSIYIYFLRFIYFSIRIIHGQ